MPIAKRAERAVCGSVAVAAHDNLARLRVALLRPNDMDDALKRTESVVERYAELFAVEG